MKSFITSLRLALWAWQRNAAVEGETSSFHIDALYILDCQQIAVELEDLD